MTTPDVLSTICVAGLLVVIAVVAADRNRLRRRLDNSEGRVSGLSLDVDALQERVNQLGSYLNRPESWDVQATPPAALADDLPIDRWAPPVPGPRKTPGRHAVVPAAIPSNVSAESSRRQGSAR